MPDSKNMAMIAPVLDYHHLLKVEQIEGLLKSVIELAPYVFYVIDPADNVLARAIPDTMPDEIRQVLAEVTRLDNLTSKITGRPFVEVRFPIEIRSHIVGYIIGTGLNLDRQAGPHNLATTVEIVGKLLVDQADKEYELNSLSTELLSRYEEITLLYELSQALGDVFDSATICEIALEMALQVITAQNAYISLTSEDGKFLTVVAVQGIKGFDGWRVPVGQGISGYVAATGSQLLLDPQEPAYLGPVRRLKASTAKKSAPPEAILAVPLILLTDQTNGQRGVLGVITLVGTPPGRLFTSGDAKLLTTIATQVTTAIHNSQLVQALREAARVQQQIEIAAEIQQSLLPKQALKLPGIELYGQCLPAANIGGDYYDFFSDETGRLTLLIADVSGHSIGTALMMATARSTLRLEIALGKPLATVLADTNRDMLEDLWQAEMFISVFCARYEPASRRLTFVNGGHNPPLLRRAADGQVSWLDAEGMILGVIEEVTCEEKTVVLEPGDVLLLYTDGAVEARSSTGKQFGEARLKRLLAKHSTLLPAKLTDRIMEAIMQHTANTVQQDDITLLVLRV